MSAWPWGKAGQRLTPDQIFKRDAHLRAVQNRSRHTIAEETERLRLFWARGEVRPFAITILLDARGFYGPQVDVECGGAEPMVDEWEAGTRYPEFDQLLALLQLCGVTPGFVQHYSTQTEFETLGEITDRSSLRFHSPEPAPTYVAAFTPDALRTAGVGIYRREKA
jgi:hypothetical protein